MSIRPGKQKQNMIPVRKRATLIPTQTQKFGAKQVIEIDRKDWDPLLEYYVYMRYQDRKSVV